MTSKHCEERLARLKQQWENKVISNEEYNTELTLTIEIDAAMEVGAGALTRIVRRLRNDADEVEKLATEKL